VGYFKATSHKLPEEIQKTSENLQSKIPVEFEYGTLQSEIHKFTNSIWNKVELPDQWKESIIIPVHKKGDKIGCNNYRGISPLLTTC
jgi:hypothetical protein